MVIGIDSHTLNSSQGKKWLVLGLVWQLIKMFLFKSISISQVPGLVNLLRDGRLHSFGSRTPTGWRCDHEVHRI